MGRKKVILSFCAIITIFFYGFQSIAAKDENEDKLAAIASIYEKNNIKINEWSLYAREIIEDSTVEEVAASVTQKAHVVKWDIQNINNHKKYTEISQQEQYNERIVVVDASTENKKEVIVIYEAKGQKWTKNEWKKVSSVLYKKIDTVFIQKPLFFSCVKGVIDDKIKSVLQVQVKNVLKELHGNVVEMVSEEAFASLSAYTEEWKDALSTDKKEMNIQIGLREDKIKNNTTITVGTPIITSEY